VGSDEDFWDDLLSDLREQALVPVVGPELTLVKIGNTEQTLTTLIAQRLAEKYELTVSPGMTTMGEAVAVFLKERGPDEVERRLYRVIKDIIREYPAPGDALRDLAAITDLRLFVTTTPDRLLAKAVNEVRFQGRDTARELIYCPSQSTSEQQRNAQGAAPSNTVVLSLFGQASSMPQYAIHDEDRLEWLHGWLSDTASLPDWLRYQLKHQPMLFVGCEIPDWIGRFLLRMSSTMRVSLDRDKQFYFVGNSPSHEPSLSDFLDTYCRKQVQQFDMAPTEFVAQLRARWEEQRPSEEDGDRPPSSPDGTIFISYMREDLDAARRLCNAVKEQLGGDVWLDERRIRPGDTWQRETLTAIRQNIRLFIAVISTNTEHEHEGYVFKEWRVAIDRSLSILGRRFIVPVIVDENYQGDPLGYGRIPDEFRPLHFGHAPAGEPDHDLLATLKDEIRDMRRSGAA
jgi:hypothetical protein